jgi:hypothetical protein
MLLRAAILASSIVLMLPGAWGHSATVVEFAQLPAGLAAWQRRSLGVYRVCGPVSKLLYALPVHLVGVQVDYPEDIDSDVCSRREWELGRIFQDQNVERYHDVYRWSRILPIIVTVLGGCLICEWSTRLFGAWPGIASLCIWCWSPPILAHGSLVTSDIPAAVAALAAARVFWACLLRPTVLLTAAVGLTLGLAAATKFTLLILYPCWASLAVLRAVQFRSSMTRTATYGLVALMISLVVLDACYLFQGVGFPLVVLGSKSSSVSRGIQHCEDSPATAWLLKVPLPIPQDFLRGLDEQIADGERLQSAYLLGETRLGGWPWWYPTAFLIKTPIPVLILFGFALVLARRAVRKSESTLWAALCLLVPAAEAAVAVAVSTGTGTNAAFRYLIPSFALTVVWAGSAFSEVKPRTAWFLLVWLILTTAIAAPDHLGWRNEAALAWEAQSRRPTLIGDSFDWSQDLARLGDWISRCAEGRQVQVYAYGLGSGRPYGITSRAALSAVDAVDTDHGQNTYVAVSIDILFGYEKGVTVDVGERRSSISERRRSVLTSIIPYARVGRTIRILRLEDVHAAESVARESDHAP